jgi:hypothetical protein
LSADLYRKHESNRSVLRQRHCQQVAQRLLAKSSVLINLGTSINLLN